MKTGKPKRRSTCDRLRLNSPLCSTAEEQITRDIGMVTPQQIENKLFLQPLADLVAKLSYYRRLERTWKLIEKDYADSNLGLAKAAGVSGISKNHLNVLMRRATGFTFYQLLIRYRLLRAVIMMGSKNYGLLEIVLETGFGSLSAFEKSFRRVMGLTPREFRKSRDL